MGIYFVVLLTISLGLDILQKVMVKQEKIACVQSEESTWVVTKVSEGINPVC